MITYGLHCTTYWNTVFSVTYTFNNIYSVELVTFHGRCVFKIGATVSLTLLKSSRCLSFALLWSMAQQSWVFQSYASQSKHSLSILNLSGLVTKLLDKTPSKLPTALASTELNPQSYCNDIFWSAVGQNCESISDMIWDTFRCKRVFRGEIHAQRFWARPELV